MLDRADPKASALARPATLPTCPAHVDARSMAPIYRPSGGRMVDLRRRRILSSCCRRWPASSPVRGAFSSSPSGWRWCSRPACGPSATMSASRIWQPKAGRWVDWGLRRESAKRREMIRKDREAIGCPPRRRANEQAAGHGHPGPAASTPEMPGDTEPRRLTLRRPRLSARSTAAASAALFHLI